MTTTVRHQPTRSTAGLAVAGQAGWSPLRPPSDLDLAVWVRAYALSVLPGRTTTVGADPDRTTLARIASHYPTAEQTFGRAALLALTRRPGPRACGFCLATLLAATSEQPAPSPSSPVLQALLGHPCHRCVARQRTQEHVAAVAAATEVEQRLLDRPVNPFTARVGYWSQRLGVPAEIVAEFGAALGPWPTGRITTLAGRRVR
jgi:hypothetical protein